MDKLTLEQAIKQHIAYGSKVEILNHKCDYVGIQYSNANGYYMLGGDIHMTYNGGSTGKSIKDFRFCLRPLSDLTKEIEHKGETFIPIIKLGFPNTDEVKESFLYVINHLHVPYCEFTKLLSWHFDVFGLIEKGLAIDINTVKEVTK